MVEPALAHGDDGSTGAGRVHAQELCGKARTDKSSSLNGGDQPGQFVILRLKEEYSEEK
jgi:hypothetical protein